MRRSASKIINNLEQRIARLEKSSHDMEDYTYDHPTGKNQQALNLIWGNDQERVLEMPVNGGWVILDEVGRGANGTFVVVEVQRGKEKLTHFKEYKGASSYILSKHPQLKGNL